MSIAIVTGASSGMGREFALQLAQSGKYDCLWVVARRRELLEQLAGEVSIPVRVMPLDLTLPESTAALADELKVSGAEVGMLVHAAGYGRFCRYEDVTEDDARSMIALNCASTVAVAGAVLPFMPDGSKVILLGSLSAFQPVPNMALYAATKAFVLSYSRALNFELRHRRITVTAVCPGWVQTEFFDHAMLYSRRAVSYFNRLYQPKDVAVKALRDSEKGRDLSILGFPVKLQTIGVKLLPHGLVMRVWAKQQNIK